MLLKSMERTETKIKLNVICLNYKITLNASQIRKLNYALN